MTWIILTLSCIVLWGITDVLYKASNDYNEPLSHCKTFVWVGIIMGVAACIMMAWTDTLPSSIEVVKENMYLIFFEIVYALALLLGILGKKYLAVSIASPLENIDGATAAILVASFMMLTGYAEAVYVNIFDILGTAAVIVAIILIAIQERSLSKQEALLPKEDKRHRFGAWALLFPLIYNVADAASMAVGSIAVSGEAGPSIPSVDFFIFECAAFVVVAIFVWLYMLIVKKYIYIPFEPEEMIRCGAATGETFGTMAFFFAASIKPVLTAPVVSSCCLVAIFFARIFLKERLTGKQTISVAVLVLGIVLLGIAEIV